MSTPTNEPNGPTPGRWSRRTRTIVAACAGGAVAIGLAVGGAAVANAATTPSTSSPSTSAPGTHGHGPRGMHSPHIGGTVTAVDGTTVTVKDFEGFTRTITLELGVTVKKDGAASTTAAIVKGTHIEARGTVDANGTTLDATGVEIGMPTRPAGGPGGWKGHGPMGGEGAAPSAAPTS